MCPIFWWWSTVIQSLHCLLLDLQVCFSFNLVVCICHLKIVFAHSNYILPLFHLRLLLPDRKMSSFLNAMLIYHHATGHAEWWTTQQDIFPCFSPVFFLVLSETPAQTLQPSVRICATQVFTLVSNSKSVFMHPAWMNRACELQTL